MLPETRPDAAAARILLVEDEPAHVEAIRRAVEASGAGYDVDAVATLAEARAYLAGDRPDLLLADLNLADGRGVDLLSEPAARGELPMLLMTSYGDEQIAVQAMRLGALDYVVKSPEAFAEMPRTVGRALREWRLIDERRRAEAALRESEATYRAVFETATDAILIVSGGIRDCNRRAVELFGRARERLLGLRPTELAPLMQGDGQVSEAALAERLTQALLGRPQRFEFQFHRFGGELLETEVSLQRILIGGEPHVVAVIHDVTEARLAARALAASEAKYRHLVEEARDLVLQVDGDGTITYCSPVITAFAGYAVDEVEGHGAVEFMADRAAGTTILQQVARAAASDTPPTVEFLFRPKHGRPFWAETTVWPVLLGGEAVGYRAIARNITERKDAERERFLLAQALQGSVDGMAVLDAGARVIHANGAFGRLVGDTEIALDRGIGEYLPIDSPELAGFDPAIGGREPWSGRLVDPGARGERPPVSLSLSPIHGEEGEAWFLLRLADIGAQLRLEEQMRQAAKLDALGTMAGGMAHDFNNLLATIMGYTELLLLDAEPHSQLATDAKQILQAARHGAQLTTQILTFARRSDQRREPFAAARVIVEAVRMMHTWLSPEVELDNRVTPTDGEVLGDPGQLHQVVMNLCVNAVQAMRDGGGTLTVRLDSVDLDERAAAALPPGLRPGTHFRLCVEDTGSGIAPDVMPRIFEPFFTTKAVGEGTGLGLAAVHGIVTSHGGVITVESTVGRGTAVTVWLPRIDGHADRGAGQLELPTSGVGRIMVVDDRPSLTAMFDRALGQLGFEVTAYNNPLVALSRFEARPDEFDVVITDQLMPEMTGLELGRYMRRRRADIPVVLLTGFGGSLTDEAVRAEGFAALLTKPVHLSELCATVRRLVKERAGS